MRGNLMGRFPVICIHSELPFRVARAFNRMAYDKAFLQHHLSEVSAEFGRLANPFRNNVPRAFKSLRCRGYAFFLTDKTGRVLFQRFSTTFLGAYAMRQ